jgi:hypothetical protein
VQLGVTGIYHILSVPGFQEGRVQEFAGIENVVRDAENAIAGNESKGALHFGQDYADPLGNIANAHPPRATQGRWKVLC